MTRRTKSRDNDGEGDLIAIKGRRRIRAKPLRMAVLKLRIGGNGRKREQE